MPEGKTIIEILPEVPGYVWKPRAIEEDDTVTDGYELVPEEEV
jgi:hypothetical protein